jgi:hypothetical protein
MNNHIINLFIHYEKVSFNNIISHLQRHYLTIDKNIVRKEINSLIRNSLLFENNKTYHLTKEGNIVKNDNMYYHSIIICSFLKKSRLYKKYTLKEVRQEQHLLRTYLTENKKQICIICNKYLPLELLETAHLKPRHLLKKHELYDKNVVEFMCRYCHKLYDSGFIGINNSEIKISKLLTDQSYDLTFEKKRIEQFNNFNERYFQYHFKYIYRSF